MKSSEIIIEKLKEAGGDVTIELLSKKEARVKLVEKNSFTSDKLGWNCLDFTIFDIVTNFLKEQKDRRAPKGGSRNSRVGEGKCNKGTVMYEIATKYYGKVDGNSSFDPLFVIAAILDWANIARNCRGYLELL
mgnify:FL=1